MTFPEIVLAMVESLRNPVTEIDMYTFGEVRKGVCYGCAATNTICRLGELVPLEELGNEDGTRYDVNSWSVIDRFEIAIERLRRGEVEWYSLMASGFFAECPTKYAHTLLPCITNGYTEEELKAYEDFAIMIQEEKGKR